MACVAALVAVGGTTQAAASVTLGQLAASPVSVGFCSGGLDRIQTGVASGTGYTVPGGGTIVSWSTNAGPNTGQEMTMKLYRKVAEPNTYAVVGHDGPEPIAQSTLNSFATSIPVKAGDILGMHTLAPGGNPTATNCDSLTPGSTEIFQASDLTDGASGPFTNTTTSDEQLNISAVLVPSNRFTFGALVRNKRRGNATLTVSVPGPGELTGSGHGARVATATQSKAVATAGDVTLLVSATGKKKRKLKRTGKAKLAITLTYTPSGGDPGSQSTTVKLKKKL